MVRWKFEAEVPGQGDRDRKIRTFKLRPGKDDELAEHEAQADAIALEWQAYYKANGTAVTVDEDVDNGPTPAPAAAPAYEDEEAPF